MQKRTVRGATVRHDGDLVSFACHCAPLATQPPATRAWRGPPERHVGGCAGAWAQSGRLPRQAPCRCCYLARSGSLSLTGPRGTLVGLPDKLLLPGPCCLAEVHGASRQVPWSASVGLLGKLLLPGPCCLAGARGTSRRVPWSALVGLPGKLLLLGPCLLSLNTLFLNGSKGTTEDLGVSPASLAAGCCNCPCTSSGY